MNNLDAILEVAIGLVLTWLIISVATVEVQNIINKIFNRRGKFLEQAILDMFRGEEEFVEAFYEQPVIKALYKKNFFGKPIKPDYIPNEAFAEALFEMFVNLGTEEGKLPEDTVSLERVIAQIEKVNAQNPELGYFAKRLIPELDITESIAKLRTTKDKVAEFKNNAESWFNNSMTKASFWYKDNAKTFALIIGIILAAVFNVDSIQITEQLWREPTLRQSLVAQAQVADETTGPKSVAELEAYYKDLDLPVGWERDQLPVRWGWVSKVIGILISGLAAMQGAPFWFDMLKKLLRFKDGESNSSTSQPAETAPAPPQAVG